jgi:ribonuclease BN (tRNA processing enzyme)
MSDDNSISILILGSGTASPSAKRGSPGLLLNIGERKLLMDSGSGTLYRMAIAGYSVHDIDIVCYTHSHPDHISDLVPLLHALKWDPSRPAGIKHLQLIGPPSVFKYYDNVLRFFGDSIASDDQKLSLQKKVMDNSMESIHGITLISRFVAHTPDSIGYRVECGAGSVVYTGDTDICESVVMLAMDCDVLIIDCSFPSTRKIKGHTTPEEFLSIAKASRAKTVILTHIYPNWNDVEWREIMDLVKRGHFLVARDFMLITLSKGEAPKVCHVDIITCFR